MIEYLPMTFKQKPLILALVILVLIVVVAAIVLTFGRKSVEQKSGTGSEQSSQSPINPSDQDLTTEEASSPIPLVSNLPSGVSASAIGAVEGKSGKANVIAVSDGKTFSLVLEAKLADSPQGQFYTAWLSKSTDDKNPFKLGKLQKDKSSYSISFNQDGDFSSYKIAIVTLETNDDNNAEIKILEGAI